MGKAMTSEPERALFRLKGWHVLGATILFFGVIALVNAFMITMAVESFPGVEQKKSYLQGLHYNQSLAQKARQQELGWHIILDEGNRFSSKTERLHVTLQDRQGLPIKNAKIVATLGRPANDWADQALTFEETGQGVYQTTRLDLQKGQWLLTIEATSLDEDTIKTVTRLWVE